MELTENGRLQHDGVAIGELKDDNTLVLNLGWMRMADMKLIVNGDPEVDKTRVVFSRPRIAGQRKPTTNGTGEQEQEDVKP